MTVERERIIIVGGGCYGLSTAVALASNPSLSLTREVILLDRSSTPPALDAASSDYNKIIRQDYSDEFYARLAAKAIRKWSSPEYAPYFFQSGCLVMAHESHRAAAYVRQALDLQSDPSMAEDGRLAIGLPTPAHIKQVFGHPGPSRLGSFEGDVAYINPQSGWANARGAMDYVCAKARKLGVQIIGAEVDELVYGQKGGKRDVVGVSLRDGRRLFGDRIIVAAGSWSSRLVPELGKELLATGQPVGHIQLTPEEVDEYKGIPVAFHMDTGFYSFPPNANGIIKFAIHCPGYVNPTSHKGQTIASLPKDDQEGLPRNAVELLKRGLKRQYPALAEKKWLETRMCWYCDSPSSDWLLDYHPDHPSLFLATGDSGHGFKFLPILGDIIAGSFEGTLEPKLKELWSWKSLSVHKGDSSRGGVACFTRQALDGDDMDVARVENEYRVNARL